MHASFVSVPCKASTGLFTSTSDATAPLLGCRTTKFPREVPLLPWYRDAPAQMVMAGFLPFSAIYIELYYIFASIWGHKLYTIYSILFIVFIILVIVTAFITVALTYFQVRLLCVLGTATAFDASCHVQWLAALQDDRRGSLTIDGSGRNLLLCLLCYLLLAHQQSPQCQAP
jgi:hypothetical protein